METNKKSDFENSKLPEIYSLRFLSLAHIVKLMIPVWGVVTAELEPEPEALLQWKLERSLELQSKHVSWDITDRFPTGVCEDFSVVHAWNIWCYIYTLG